MYISSSAKKKKNVHRSFEIEFWMMVMQIFILLTNNSFSNRQFVCSPLGAQVIWWYVNDWAHFYFILNIYWSQTPNIYSEVINKWKILGKCFECVTAHVLAPNAIGNLKIIFVGHSLDNRIPSTNHSTVGIIKMYFRLANGNRKSKKKRTFWKWLRQQLPNVRWVCMWCVHNITSK